MKEFINREMTEEEINKVKCFDDLLFRKSRYSTKDIAKRVLTVSFKNGNSISCIEEIDSNPRYTMFNSWNCILSIVTDKETNEILSDFEHSEYNICLDDKDEFLRIFLLNRDYTCTTNIVHTINKTTKEK